jgi:hypothetical protein
MTLYVMNAPVRSAYGDYRFRGPKSVEEARQLLRSGFVPPLSAWKCVPQRVDWTTGVCHEALEAAQVMEGPTLRSLPTGAGSKPPRAALAEDCCREHRGKRHIYVVGVEELCFPRNRDRRLQTTVAEDFYGAVQRPRRVVRVHHTLIAGADSKDRIDALHQKVDRLARRLEATHTVLRGIAQEIRLRPVGQYISATTGTRDSFAPPAKDSQEDIF